MGTRSANITLDELVRTYLIEEGDSTLHRYSRTLMHAISGLHELNMDTSGVPTEVYLDIESNNTVPLPDDFIEYTIVGVLDNGNIHYLGHNTAMGLRGNVDNCGNINKNQIDIENDGNDGVVYSYGASRNGESSGKMFGLGGGGNRYGYFKIDYANNYISLQDMDVSFSSIYLQYIADISKVDGQYVVHPYITEALKSWIFWKSLEKNLRVSDVRIQTARASWRSERKKSNKRFTKFNTREAAESFRKANKLSPRF